MGSDEAKPLSDRIIEGVKNRRSVAYVIVACTVITGIAGFTDSISKLWTMFGPSRFDPIPQPEVLKANLIKLAYDGCYFFRWDHSNVMEVPNDVSEAQEGHFDQLMGRLGSDGIVVIEGYVEPGYTRQYALALGERRANALKELLVKKHALDAIRIRTISYGKEREPIQTAEYFCGAKMTPQKE